MSKVSLELGTHGSVTSLIVGTVRHFRIFVGQYLFKPKAYNIKGLYEDIEFLNLNQRVMKDEVYE